MADPVIDSILQLRQEAYDMGWTQEGLVDAIGDVFDRQDHLEMLRRVVEEQKPR